ncbi:hypothetical protein PPROV_000999800 [Pycnococcus provasolii]|uniref:Uncharacterized protein n=1 Tax=Pycnococcus provasolii TaxID=41880 RepID=A0A830HZL4_9CHLO|nr:hypothetical protein PPROV_000999800 [Pycnococcus provasolii]
MDAAYLKDTVGPALASACAATAIAMPPDPVEYLGMYLLKHVKNVQVETAFFDEKAVRLAREQEEAEKAEVAALAAAQLAEAKEKAVAQVRALVAEPNECLQAAVDVISKFTECGGAYAMNVVSPPVVDTPLEEDEDDDALAEAQKACVEQEVADSAALEEEIAKAQEEEDAAKAAAEEAGEPWPPEEEPVETEVVEQDYSECFLDYIVASEGQSFMVGSTLKRGQPENAETDPPTPATEDEGVSLSVLDEDTKSLELKNVLYNEKVKHFKKFPRVGGYAVHGLKSVASTTRKELPELLTRRNAYKPVEVPEGEEPKVYSVLEKAKEVPLEDPGRYRVMIATDSLKPRAEGKPFAEADLEFIAQVAKAVEEALQEREATFVAPDKADASFAAYEALLAAVAEIDAAAVEEQEKLEAEHATKMEELPAAEEAASVLPEEPPVEVPEGEEPPPPTSEELNELLLAAQKAVPPITPAEALVAAATHKHATSLSAFMRAVEDLKACGADAFTTLISHGECNPPELTYQVLKAALFAVGYDYETFNTWRKLRTLLTPSFVEEIFVAFDFNLDRSKDTWKWVRALVKPYEGIEAGTLRPALKVLAADGVIGLPLLGFLTTLKRVQDDGESLRAAVKSLNEFKVALQVADDAVKIRKEFEEAERLAKEEAERLEREKLDYHEVPQEGAEGEAAAAE